MPELPDITLYVDAFNRLIVGECLQKIDVKSPFVLRTFEPDIFTFQQQTIECISTIGKRIVWHFENGQSLVFHLMIAGRFHRKKVGTRARGKNDLIAFAFADFSLLLTEASSKKRAGVWTVTSDDQLSEFDPGGLDPLTCTLAEFNECLRRKKQTIKRALTSPANLSGIGNAYSDEILLAARISPLKLTTALSEQEVANLYEATQQTLSDWIARLREQFRNKPFPEKITAFRPEMAAHGKFGQPCPLCGTAIQRITYADNETNYCPTCQTAGKIYKDRSLSRLLKDDWPQTVEEWEQ